MSPQASTEKEESLHFRDNETGITFSLRKVICFHFRLQTGSALQPPHTYSRPPPLRPPSGSRVCAVEGPADREQPVSQVTVHCNNLTFTLVTRGLVSLPQRGENTRMGTIWTALVGECSCSSLTGRFFFLFNFDLKINVAVCRPHLKESESDRAAGEKTETPRFTPHLER